MVPLRLSRYISYLATACLALVASNASANCMLYSFSDSEKVEQVISEFSVFSFENYDTVCTKLSEANAVVFVVGDYGVLGNRSFGWVSVYIADKSNLSIVMTNASVTSNHMDEIATDDKAKELLWLSINGALNIWGQEEGKNLEKAIVMLDQVR